MAEDRHFAQNLIRTGAEEDQSGVHETYRLAQSDGVLTVHRPHSDVISSPDDQVEPLPDGQVDLLVRSAEEATCGGVNMAELVLDKLIEFKKTSASTEIMRLHGNHPPSKGAERSFLYEQAGVDFKTPIDDIKPGAVYLFSAHGADPDEIDRAEAQGLWVVDTTCSLVDRVYHHVRRASAEGSDPRETGVLYLAPLYKSDHPEVVGTRGVVRRAGFSFIPITGVQDVLQALDSEDPRSAPVGPEAVSLNGVKKLLVTGLTTSNAREVLAMAAALQAAAEKHGFDIVPYSSRDVCRTVQYRQEAMREVVADARVATVIIVGAVASNNTTELVRVAVDSFTGRQLDIRYVNHFSQIPRTVEGGIGVLSGASTQQRNVDQLVTYLNPTNAEVVGRAEKLDLFRPLGGGTSLASRILKGDFTWFGEGVA